MGSFKTLFAYIGLDIGFETTQFSYRTLRETTKNNPSLKTNRVT